MHERIEQFRLQVGSYFEALWDAIRSGDWLRVVDLATLPLLNLFGVGGGDVPKNKILLALIAAYVIDLLAVERVIPSVCYVCSRDLVCVVLLVVASVVIGFTLSQSLSAFRDGSGSETSAELPDHLAPMVSYARANLVSFSPIVFLLMSIGARLTAEAESIQWLAFYASAVVMTLAVTVILFIETELRDDVDGVSRPLALKSPDGGKPRFFKWGRSPIHAIASWLISVLQTGCCRSCCELTRTWWRQAKRDVNPFSNDFEQLQDPEEQEAERNSRRTSPRLSRALKLALGPEMWPVRWGAFERTLPKHHLAYLRCQFTACGVFVCPVPNVEYRPDCRHSVLRHLRIRADPTGT